MIFFPFIFLVFLFIILLTMRWLHDAKQQNFVLLLASYLFYAWWDWRFLSLLILVSFIVYQAAKHNHDSRFALPIGLGVPLLSLVICKYYNFFLDSFYTLIGSTYSHTLTLILPLGISFYTFIAVSYFLDVYHGKIPAEDKFIVVALYISFFPTVISGPITKARHLIGQFHESRIIQWENFQAGIQIFIMGCLKKYVLADRIGVFVDDIYGTPLAFDSFTVWLAVISYSLQLYLDFAGYSDIAIGGAQCLGFTLNENFNLPYIAKNISDFWKRWHISLSSWFQEYLYIPLGGNRAGILKAIRNLMITMLICGLWHGAAWKFVLWGCIHGCLLCLYHIYTAFFSKRIHFPTILKILITYLSVTLCWVFFRGTDLQNITDIFYRLFIWESFGVHQMYVYAWLSIFLLIAVSFYSTYRNDRNGLTPNMDIRQPSRFFIFLLELFVLLGLMYTGSNPFVYASF